MKPVILGLIILFFYSTTSGFTFDKTKLVYYGNFGLQFGNITMVNLSPTIGYQFSTKLVVGVGPIFNYVKYNSGYGVYSNLTYGARVYAKYFFLENLYLIGDYQLINNYWISSTDRTWVDIPLFGLGYRQSISNRVYFDFSVLWNFNPLLSNYYSNPIIRGGISFQ